MLTLLGSKERKRREGGKEEGSRREREGGGEKEREKEKEKNRKEEKKENKPKDKMVIHTILSGQHF